jgi:hypothetical protein
MTAPPGSSLVDVGHAGAALDGLDSGDLHLVAPFPSGVLLALIDGLGHGREARDAAREAARLLASNPGDPITTLVKRCHEALRKTRGVVMSLASLSARSSSITWLGVGNVECVLLRKARAAAPASESVQLRGGVVGYQLPPLRETTVTVAPGDVLMMVSDGVQSGFTVGVALERSPQSIADDILRRHARGTDDTLILVARYLGAAA